VGQVFYMSRRCRNVDFVIETNKRHLAANGLLDAFLR
jgi:hypothetical protein